MRQWLTGGVWMMAVVASVATSAPRTQWNVVGGDKHTDVLDRDTDLAVFDVQIEANAVAMSMPITAPQLEERAPDEPLEAVAVEPSFHGELRVRMKASTKGVMGVDSDATDVTLRVIDRIGNTVATETLLADTLEPAFFDLWVPDTFAGCEPEVVCDDAYTIEVETSVRSRLKVKLDVDAWLRGDAPVNAPREADIDVEIQRL